MENTEPRTDTAPLRRFRDPAYIPVAATLGELRERIDSLDRDIVRLLAERGRCVKDATRFKADSHQVAAPARQAEVIVRVRARAVAEGADADVVEAAYRAMIAAFVSQEQVYFGETETVEKETP
ncbi:MAG: chorismate mutase [Betaproteobacteria bacterium]|nr:chorismate mutase [Betaproteobacteria bacterium]